MQIFELLKKDHRKVEKLFSEIEGTAEPKKREKLFEQIYKELSMHAEAEELTFYAAMREYEETEALLDEAEEEHVEMKVMLEEMKSLDATSPDFAKKLLDLKNAVQHHVEEEESEVFPTVEDCMDEEELEQLADDFKQTKTQLQEEMLAAR